MKRELERRKLELGIAPSTLEGKFKGKGANGPSTRGQSRKRWRTQGDEDFTNVDSEEERSRNGRNSYQGRMDVVILDEGERLPSAKLKIRKFIPPMNLLDINKQEEDRDRVQILMWMNKFQKLFKMLFNKYANTIRNNVEANFLVHD